jgi:hypothetical protein
MAASSAFLLLVCAAACSTEEQQGAHSASAEMQPEVFTFAPPDGTKGVRTEHRRFEASIIGAPLRSLEEQELRWNMEAKHTGDQYTINQELAHVTLKHDGETVVDADVKPGSVVAQLIIDKAGNLVDVRGMEGTAKTLLGMLPPKLDSMTQKMAEKDLSPQTLRAEIATRYEETLGDIVGRPTKVGTSWTTQGRPGGPVISRTLGVEKMEPCGQAICSRIQAVYKLNPRTMLTVADDVIAKYARMVGHAPSKMDMQAATYSMQGSLLTEPATMINHAATLDETGKVMFEDHKKPMEIDLQGKTDMTFEYGTQVSTTGVASPSVAAQP